MTSSKTQQLKQIRDEVWQLKESPLYEYRTKNKYYPVLGEGSHDAKIMFIGEAPGENEAKQGRPFCGAAGRVLDELCASIDLSRKDVYVTNIVKDRPPGNRDPNPAEIAIYAPFLDKQISIIQPDVIATLGRFSMVYIMEKFGLGNRVSGISAMHGKAYEAWADYGVVNIVPLYHPAVALYRASQKEELLKNFQVLKEYL
ncbi:uracil-DNA glycosylase [Candidatus Beckwithbacteria bacterium]|nr:uracil-DNA glycosylase [Candidatus Beckwithbacteria bacterium]